jgi:hypothetical protein
MELENRIKKYHNRFRLLVIKTNNYKDQKYQEWKHLYLENQKLFHKYYIKLLVVKTPSTNKTPSIELYGFDSILKVKYSTLNVSRIIEDVEKMPMGQHVKPINQSLFVDYNPKTTIHGLGYKDTEKALETINKIKNQPIIYQKQVINTMIGRAKHHPNQTSDMRKAIIIFQDYLEKHLEKSSTKTMTKQSYKNNS